MAHSHPLDNDPDLPLDDDMADFAAEDQLYAVAEIREERVVHESTTRFGALLNGKDEMNLAEFPIARLGRNDTRLTIEYKGQITDKLGNIIEQRWLVSGNATFGLPTEFADRVLVALMYITNQQHLNPERNIPERNHLAKRPVDRRVPFTIYRILKLLGLSRNQRNYEAVEKALQQLVGVTIYSEGAFWDHQHQKRVTTKKGFHILEEFWLKSFEDEDPRAVHPDGDQTSQDSVTGYVVWGERIWDSFQAGYIKNLDVEFYYALENTLARRLYRFLDKRMHYQPTYQIDIFDLAARMGMKPYPFASHLARKLKPAFDELQAQGFLARVDLIKVGDFTRVRFERAQAAARLELYNAESTDDAAAPTTPESSHTVTDGLYDDFDASRVESITRDTEGASAPVFSLSSEHQALWRALLDDYQRTLPPATYAMLANSQLVSLEGGRATISVDARYQEWLTRQMSRQIKTYLNQQLERERARSGNDSQSRAPQVKELHIISR